MTNLPMQPGGANNSNTPLHVIPDPIKGGWNVYSTVSPHEAQVHFQTRDEAIFFAEELARKHNLGYSVEENEAPAQGR